MSTDSQGMPELQAGGGNPSGVSASRGIGTLSPAVLAHLMRAYATLQIHDQGLDGPSEESGRVGKFLHRMHGIGSSSEKDHSPKQDDVGLDQFLEYMTSPTSSALGPPTSHDLSWPITSYFISSSHNTYLTGNQLYSESSTDAYKNVLLRGCRCIEIDVWDGEPRSWSSSERNSSGEDEKKRTSRLHLPSRLSSHSATRARKDASHVPPPATDSLSLPTPWTSASKVMRAEPRVLHGYTLTKDVPFRDVCTAIREAAFVTSDLPVIVSLEIHTSLEQQEIMVEIMEEVWAGLLVSQPLSAYAPDQKLPSPGELRRKILVKVKYVAPTPAGDGASALQRARSTSSTSVSEDDISLARSDQKKKKSTKILEALSRLGVYTRSYHFSSLSQPEATTPAHVFSLSEKALMEVHQSHGPTLFSHNRNYLMRAYPSGLRVSSSNLDPSVFWRKGVQMVALNWQKCDQGMMLNEGMFAGEGGWVLKPKGYRSVDRPQGDCVISYESQADAIAHKTLDLTVEIFAGQAIPLPIGDESAKGFHPYVKCELHVEKPEERTGEPIEGAGKSKDGAYKRRTKKKQGVDPDFEGERLEFLGIPGVVEELSFMRIKIHDSEIGKDSLAAWACIRLDRLRVGWRFVHLLDAWGREAGGVLLVRIGKRVS